MAIVTNYICDVSGKSSTDKKDFITVTINCVADPTSYPRQLLVSIEKLLHKETAAKLKLLPISHGDKEDKTIPTPTIESQIATLLRDFVQEIAYESTEYMSNRG